MGEDNLPVSEEKELNLDSISVSVIFSVEYIENFSKNRSKHPISTDNSEWKFVGILHFFFRLMLILLKFMFCVIVLVYVNIPKYWV